MSDYDINKMDFKQLRNEVQLLRDELAIMQRKYEDLLYNLDTENFSQRIVKQGNDMYTKIEQTAESITLQAEKVEENSKNIATLEITAEEISSEVFEEEADGTKVSRIEQNANAIEAEVTARQTDVSDLSSLITQTAEKIQMTVNASYSKPVNVATFNEGTADESLIYYETSTEVYHYFDGEKWCTSDTANIYTVFEQTATGFKLKGNVTVDGSLVTNISKVNETLYLGELAEEISKRIYFNGTGNIYSFQAFTGAYTGIGINASDFRIDMLPERFYFKKDASSYISLEDYIENNVSATAVFA